MPLKFYSPQNGHAPQKLLFGDTLEYCFFFFLNCWTKNIQNLISYKKVISILVAKRPLPLKMVMSPSKSIVKCIVSLSVQNLLFCSRFESVPGLWLCEFRCLCQCKPIVITPKEQTGTESIVYSAGIVTRSSSFTKPGFKNMTAPEQTITNN